MPASADAAALAMRACATRLFHGAPVLLYGRLDEGFAGASAVLGGLFDSAVAADGGVLISTRSRAAANEADRGRAVGCADLHASWVTYPGLFAGGGVDVMSAALLRHLPMLPERARVLDFAAGSGYIAHGLLARQPSLRLTLLDSDALAVEAARENVPAARRVLLSSCWDGLPRRLRFRVIVSNPPVHAGAADDLRVVLALLRGAAARLLPGGELWIVAQAQVPVGRLAASLGGYRSMKPAALEGGRFVAWRLRVPGGA